jgi:hypothetical protein
MPTDAFYEGGCHCGAVRFRVHSQARELWRCNCSMCSKRGDLQLIVPEAEFELLSGAEQLVVYQFNKRVAKHRFCRVCGIHSFNTPRSNPDCVAVNVRCLDAEPAEGWSVEDFDGQNWERSMGREGD